MSAQACASPISSASAIVKPASSRRGAAARSATSITRGADRQRDGGHQRRPQLGLDVVVEEQPDDDRRDGADGDQPDQARRKTRAPAESAEGSAASMARMSGQKIRQDGGQRADVQRDVERQPELGRLPAEEEARQDQVRRARDRQELGESLDDAQERGGQHRSAAAYDARRRVGLRAGGAAASGRRRLALRR